MSTLDVDKKHLTEAQKELAILTGLALPAGTLSLSLSLLQSRIVELENRIHDHALELLIVSDAWQARLRVPVAEINRLGLEPQISDYSWRDNAHYYLESTDAAIYGLARKAEGGQAFEPEQLTVESFPHRPEVTRLDDYRARDWAAHLPEQAR
jgi:hypothetical protein